MLKHSQFQRLNPKWYLDIKRRKYLHTFNTYQYLTHSVVPLAVQLSVLKLKYHFSYANFTVFVSFLNLKHTLKKVTVVWIITGSHDCLIMKKKLGTAHVKRVGYISNLYISRTN